MQPEPRETQVPLARMVLKVLRVLRETQVPQELMARLPIQVPQVQQELLVLRETRVLQVQLVQLVLRV